MTNIVTYNMLSINGVKPLEGLEKGTLLSY